MFKRHILLYCFLFVCLSCFAFTQDGVIYEVTGCQKLTDKINNCDVYRWDGKTKSLSIKAYTQRNKVAISEWEYGTIYSFYYLYCNDNEGNKASSTAKSVTYNNVKYSYVQTANIESSKLTKKQNSVYFLLEESGTYTGGYITNTIYITTEPEKTYTITFDANGGLIPPNGNMGSTISGHPSSLSADCKTGTVEVIANQSYFRSLPNDCPMRMDYTFEGWYTDKTAGIQVYDASGACIVGKYWDSNNKWIGTSNLTLYAHWKANSNTISMFSINDSTKIRFAPGNLQYTTTGSHKCADGTTQKGTWRFAPHQYDIIGQENKNASADYTGWIDLFGYGTSGWKSDAVCYQPYSTSETSSDYINHNLVEDYKYADWGVYNAIVNGGNQPNQWRLLTADEMQYLLNGRPNANQKYAVACIDGIEGLIFLPDNWEHPKNVPFVSGLASSASALSAFCELNSYTIEQWNILEEKGAIFLPHARVRIGQTYHPTNQYLQYYVSTGQTENTKSVLSCHMNTISVNAGSKFKEYGNSVRLVQEAKKCTITTNAENGSIIGGGTYYVGDTITLSVTPNDCYRFAKWSDNNTNNPRSVKVTQDSTFTAIFEKIQYKLSVDLNDTEHGEIEAKETNE